MRLGSAEICHSYSQRRGRGPWITKPKDVFKDLKERVQVLLILRITALDLSCLLWMCWLCTLLHQHIKYRKHQINFSAALARAVVKPICSYREARSALLQQASWLGLAWGPERALWAWEPQHMELVFKGNGTFRASVVQGCHYQGP